MANKFGNPICRCLGKLVPKPDTITGCGPECTVRNAFIFIIMKIHCFEHLQFIQMNFTFETLESVLYANVF